MEWCRGDLLEFGQRLESPAGLGTCRGTHENLMGVRCSATKSTFKCAKNIKNTCGKISSIPRVVQILKSDISTTYGLNPSYEPGNLAMNQKQGKTGDSFQPWRFSCKDIRTRGCISSNGISQECLVVALNVVGIGCLFSCTMSQHVSAISCRWFVQHTSLPVLVTFGHCLFFKKTQVLLLGKSTTWHAVVG